MKKRIALDLDKNESTVLVGKALSSEERLQILRLLVEHSATISEIAKTFNMPLSSAALHIKVLEEAGLISTKMQPGIRGSSKSCGIAFEDIYFNVFVHRKNENQAKVIKYDMPIGNYFDCQISEPCGIISEKEYLGLEDTSYGFYSNERFKAQLLWFTSGYVEYRFPADIFANKNVTKLKFSFEICSEAPGNNDNWPSDITVWVNGVEVDKMFIKGNYGDKRGALNPEWWRDNLTQYGELRTVSITKHATFDNKVKCSEATLDSLKLTDNNFVTLKIGVKPDAENLGGLNLFGDKFGDFPQAIIMSVTLGDENQTVFR